MFFNGVMLKTPMPTQHELEMVTLEELVPKDHLLRQIDAAVDFEFIRAKVAHLYCADNGRPALDPVVMFKLLFIGYLFGVRSERQLMREVQVNVAYRWFARFRLTDKGRMRQRSRRIAADASRTRRLSGDLRRDRAAGDQARAGRRSGLYTDSTHLKANANKGKFDVVKLEQTPAAYTEALNAAVDADRAAHGRKPLDRDDDEPPSSKDTKLSRTDPDSGYMVRDDKPKGFFYLDHRTVDAKHAIITDTHMRRRPSVHDSQPYLDRLDRQRERFEFKVEAVGLDAGYFTPAVCQGLEERGIAGVMGYRTPNHKPGMFYKRQFKYDAYRNEYVCPQGQALPYSTTNRLGYREYKSNAQICGPARYDRSARTVRSR
ncbi:hypothetical protein DM79_A788 [Burkholderia mallei]|uniref:IS1182 family transposase n=1 Tax=Burkholderia mallei TaxID=13373 RepID=UPI0005DC9A92|nr:IS1182 family transposase [Burkholderia mallei]KIY04545.1 hypothetical protein DM79_A788 [Burkholderia mallei]